MASRRLTFLEGLEVSDDCAHPFTLVAVSVVACAVWVVWAVLIFHIGTRILPSTDTRVTLDELLRTTGFSAAPGLLLSVAVVHGMSVPVFVATGLWMLATMIVAVQHALDYASPWRALAVCLVAMTIVITLTVTLGVVWGPALS